MCVMCVICVMCVMCVICVISVMSVMYVMYVMYVISVMCVISVMTQHHVIVNRDNIHHSQTCRKQGDGNLTYVSSFRANQRERGNLLQLQRDEIATRLKALAMM